MALYGWTCWLCGQQIENANEYSVDHVIPRSIAPELTWDRGNWRPAHLGKVEKFGCPGNKGRGARVGGVTARESRKW